MIRFVEGVTDMGFVPSFPIGNIVSNREIIAEFKCGNMGGMRRSRLTNTLIIISDKTKGLYEDKWFGDVLHYTGMGKSDDQDLNFMQNKTLAESNSNGVEVHLFEVLNAKQYVYLGPVFLCEKPYTSNQPGDDGKLRLVWIFPVKLKSDQSTITSEQIENQFEVKSRQARRLSDSDLLYRARNSQSEKVPVRIVSSPTYIRNAYVSELAKRRASGFCQLCKNKAPFKDAQDLPYLETHHVIWLSQGGPDTIENTVALCPNCHRKMHIVNSDEDIKRLRLIQDQGI
jgi:5-methylcytosine-specific restriction protein A